MQSDRGIAPALFARPHRLEMEETRLPARLWVVPCVYGTPMRAIAVASDPAEFSAIPADRRCAFSYPTGRPSTTAGGSTVPPSIRLAFIGNSLPRRCGIATFTTDLQQAVARSCATAQTAIVAMNDSGQSYEYPQIVRAQVDDGRLKDYIRAAESLNAGQFDTVSLQHEFGIFGGDAGANVLTL